MSDDSTFSRIHLEGGRYQIRGFPLDTIGELIQYQNLILHVAGELWLKDNPHRIDPPATLANELKLRLIRIEKGSVVSVLEREGIFESDELSSEDIFDCARDLVQDTLRSVRDNNKVPIEFPAKSLHIFKKFGNSFSESEIMEIQVPGKSIATFNKEIHEYLSKAADDNKINLDKWLSGRITALDTEKKSFVLTTNTNEHIEGRIGKSDILEDFIDVLNKKNVGRLTRVYGNVEKNSFTGVTKIKKVEQIMVFTPEQGEFESRLTELAELNDGWHDGAGQIIELPVIEIAGHLTTEIQKNRKLGRPQLFPMPAGGAQLEWLWRGKLVSIEISPNLEIECSIMDEKTFEQKTNVFRSVSDLMFLLNESLVENRID